VNCVSSWNYKQQKVAMFEILTAVLGIQVFQYAVTCHWDCLTLKTKALQYFEMSGTTHPKTQCQSI